MKIRRANCGDAESVARLTEESLGYPCNARSCAARLEEIGKDRRAAVFVAETDGLIIGYVQVQTYISVYADPSGEVMALCVDEDFRRRGAASALIRQTENWAREHGMLDMRLTSRTYRMEAHAFYEACGYECVNEAKKFHKRL